MLFGCNFNPKGKSEGQMANFRQNYFEVTLNNLVNPWVVKDTSEIKIEVFNRWNSKASQPEQKITGSKNLLIPSDSFILSVKTISNISYSLSNPNTGETTDLSITFEPKISIPSDGICYVKYTFPEELDISQATIEASGMLVDEQG